MQLDLHWANVPIRMRFAFCLLLSLREGNTHTPHICFALDTRTVCSYMFKAQAEVTSLWNAHNNGDCCRSVGCFCIKNSYFMLRLLLAIMVHQVVTWKQRKNWKAIDPKCHMALMNSYVPSLSEEYLGLFWEFPWPILWILCPPPPRKLGPHSMKSVINSSTLGVLCELFWPQSKTVRNCTMGLFHGEWLHSRRRGLLSHHLLLSAGPSLPSSDGIYGSPRPSYYLNGVQKCQSLGSSAFISIFFLTEEYLLDFLPLSSTP